MMRSRKLNRLPTAALIFAPRAVRHQLISSVKPLRFVVAGGSLGLQPSLGNPMPAP